MRPKLFDDSNIKVADLRSLICKHAKSVGVYKLVFNTQAKKVDGTYNSARRILFLNAKQSKKCLLRTFFHELGHHTAYLQNLWVDYHFDIRTLKPETQFLIENNIDIIAEALWNNWVCTKSWGKYKYYYPQKNKTKLTQWLTKYNK